MLINVIMGIIMAIPAYLMTKDLEKRIEPIEDSLTKAMKQINVLGYRVTYLEKENNKLTKEVEALKLKLDSQ
jgi:biopolymer transport protein ExbB/TolQ